jgi:hypothetical protein
MKEETTNNRLRSIDTGALTTFGSFACTERKKKDNGDAIEPTGTLSGSRSGRAALRREQQEQLESNHRENRVAEKKGEMTHRSHKHSPQKKEMAERLKVIWD